MSLDAISTELTALLTSTSIKIALLICIIACVSRLLPDHRAGWRSTLWSAALTAVLLMPLAGRLLPELHVPLLPAARFERSPVKPVPISIEAVPPLAGKLVLKPADPPTNPAAPPPHVPESQPVLPEKSFFPLPDWQQGIVTVYLCGVLFFLIRIIIALFHIRRITRHALPFPAGEAALLRWSDTLGITMPIRIGLSAEVMVPTVAGIRRPMILLPPNLTESSYNHLLDGILLHELAHIKRHDPFWNLIGRLAIALYWFHPLVHRAYTALSASHENACDDWAVRILGDTSGYASTLLTVASNLKRVTTPGALPIGIGMAHSVSVFSRVDRIMSLGGRISPRIGKCAAATLIGAVLLATMLIGSLQAVERDPVVSRHEVSLEPFPPQSFDKLTVFERYQYAVTTAERYDYPEAVRILEGIIEEAPDFISARIRAMDFLNRHDMKRRLMKTGTIAFDHLIDVQPIREKLEPADRYYLTAVEARIDQTYDEAIAAMRARLDLEPTDRTFLFDLGRFLEEADRSAEALAIYERLNRLYPYDPAVMYSMAARLFALEDQNRARPLLERAVALVPNEALWHETLGDLYVSIDDEKAAISAYEKATHYRPSRYEVWHKLGGLYQKQGQSYLAIRAYDKAKIHSTTNMVQKWELILEDEGDTPGVRDRLEQEMGVMLTESGNSPEAMYQVARGYLLLGYNDRAELLFQAIHDKEPVGQAAQWVAMDRVREALKPAEKAFHLEEFLRAFPESRRRSMVHHMLLDNYSELADTEGIIRTADRMMAEKSSMPPDMLYLSIASILAENGIDLDRAERLAKQAYEIKKQELAAKTEKQTATDAVVITAPGTGRRFELAGPLNTLGWIYVKQGRYEEAEKALLEALDAYKGVGFRLPYTLFYRLGVVYDRQGKIDDAIAMHGKAMEAMGERGSTEDIELALTGLYMRQNKSREEIDQLLTDLKPRKPEPKKQPARRIQINWDDQINEKAPDFSLPSMDGTTVSLSDYRGRVVVLNFWAAWSASSKWALQYYQPFHERFKNRRVVFIAVSIDEPDTREAVKPFIEERGYTFPVLYDDTLETMKDYEVEDASTIVIIDTYGRIQFKHTGFNRATLERIYAEVQALME